MTTSQAQESIRRFAGASVHYLENALELLNQGEPAKAGELLWGSMAQALQAVALSHGTPLANHRSLRWFASQLAKELSDRSILDGFWQAEKLHSNFHDVDLSVEDVATMVDAIKTTVSRLLSLVPAEILRET